MAYFKIFVLTLVLGLTKNSKAQAVSVESCFPHSYATALNLKSHTLPVDQLTAVLQYTTASGAINNYLRFGEFHQSKCVKGGDFKKCQKKNADKQKCLKLQAELIDEALTNIERKNTPAENQSTYTGYVKVFRGTHQYAPYILNKSPGEVIKLSGLTSTSYSQEVAEGFMPIFGENGKIDNKTRLMEIHTVSGAEIPSNVGFEREVLLPHNTTFEIISVKTLTEMRTNYEDLSEHEVSFEYLVLKEVKSQDE